MSRQPFLTSLSMAVLAFSTLAVGSANAKECKIDSDCGSGFECILGTIGTTTAAGTGGSTGSVGGGAAAGAATGTACAGPDCPVSTRAPAQPVGDSGSMPPKTMPSYPPDGGVVVGIPTPTDAGLTTPVITTGFCQIKLLTCASKADCPANLDCVKQTVGVPRPACLPDQTCEPTVPSTSETGTCQAVCEVDSDCPAPLVCKLHGAACMGGAAIDPDGTVTTLPTTCTGGNKICSYEPVTCSTDAECADANYQCAKVSESSMCSGSGPVCRKLEGDADMECSTPEPPVCTTTVVNNCEPKQMACDAGQACPSGWSCFDFANFENAAIPGWTTPMPSKACLPDGLILAAKGQAHGSTGVVYGSGPGRGGTSGTDLGGKQGTSETPTSNTGNSTPPLVTPVPASDGQENVAGDAGIETTSAKVRGGGCSLGGTPDSAFGLGLTLGLCGLVLRLVRRRK